MAEVDTLGIAGSARGVEGGCDTVFVEIGEVEFVIRLGQQTLILADGFNRCLFRCIVVGELNPGLDRFDLALDRVNDREEVVVYQDHVVFGVVHGVDNLIRRQPDVDRVQNRPNHRNGKETLEVPGRIPVHHCNGITRLHAGIGQCVGQAVDALNQICVGVLAAVGVDNFLVRVIPGAGQQESFDQQRVLVGVFSRGQNAGLCHYLFPLSQLLVLSRETGINLTQFG